MSYLEEREKNRVNWKVLLALAVLAGGAGYWIMSQKPTPAPVSGNPALSESAAPPAPVA